MTDYEKKYNEALSKCKAYIDDTKKRWSEEFSKATEGVFKEIFPELRESEKERIINQLIHLVQNTGEVIPIPDNKEELLDYLEKQKEQNCKDEEFTDFTIYHPLKNGKGKYECIPYSFYGSLTSFSEDKDLIDFLRTCFYTKKECNEWIEQQEEQKPAEIVDESTKRLNDNWMKQHFNDYKEQKPVVSREEILHQLLQNGSITLSDYLYLTGEPKPAEWSEEDEKMVRFYEADYNNQIGDMSMKDVIDMRLQFKNWIVNRLKSLRPQPQWKPSEEQMEALKCAIEDIARFSRRGGRQVEFENEPYYMALHSLYEQLQKLM